MGGIYEGFDGYQVVTARDLSDQADDDGLRALWNRRENLRRWYGRMRGEMTLRQRLGGMGKLLALGYDVDVKMVERLVRTEACQARGVRHGHIVIALDRLAWYVDRFPRFGRYAGVGDAQVRLMRLFFGFKIQSLRNIRWAIRHVDEARRLYLAGERAERKRMEREARLVRLSLGAAMMAAWEDIEQGRNANAGRKTLERVAHYRRELEVALGG